VWPQKSHGEKECEIPGGSQEIAVIVWLLTKIQVTLCCLLHVSLFINFSLIYSGCMITAISWAEAP